MNKLDGEDIPFSTKKKHYTMNKDTISKFFSPTDTSASMRDDSEDQTAMNDLESNKVAKLETEIIPLGNKLDNLSLMSKSINMSNTYAEIGDVVKDFVYPTDMDIKMGKASPPQDVKTKNMPYGFMDPRPSPHQNEYSDFLVLSSDVKHHPLSDPTASEQMTETSSSPKSMYVSMKNMQRQMVMPHHSENTEDLMEDENGYLMPMTSKMEELAEGSPKNSSSPESKYVRMKNMHRHHSPIAPEQMVMPHHSENTEDEDGFLMPMTSEMEELAEGSQKDEGGEFDANNQPLLLRVRGVTKNVSKDSVLFFFENGRRSGGGEIQNIKYIPENDEAIIQFQDEDSVNKVLAKGPDFVIGETKLTVENFIPPKPLPVAPLKLLISGINEETTDECLRNFLESRCEALPVDIEYIDDKNTALVTFDEEPNFGKLCKACSTKTLEGSTLTVSRVVISNCVKVTGYKTDTLKETILHYFENHRRSGGGPIDRIEDDPALGHMLIYFENIEDAVIVSKTERMHAVDGVSLSVSMHHDCLKDNNAALSFSLPEPVVMADISDQIVTFLKSSPPNRKTFEDDLQKCHAKVYWPQNQDKDSLKFLCTLDGDEEDARMLAADWPERVQMAAKKHFDALIEREISTVKEAWDVILNKLGTINITHPEEVSLITKKDSCTIYFVGYKQTVEKLHMDVSKMINEMESEVTQQERKVTKMKKLKLHQIVLLRAAKFTKMMEHEFPAVKIDADLQSGEVTFHGSHEDIENTMIKMLELLNSFASKKMELSKEACDLLFVKETRDYVKKRMMNCNVIGAWEVIRGEQGIKLYGRNDVEVKQAISIMKSSIREGVIQIPKVCEAAFKSADWTHLTNKLVTNNSGHICLHSRRGSVLLVVTDDIFPDVHKEITTFLTLHAIQEEVMSLSSSVVQFLTRHKDADLKQIESSLEKLSVHIKEAPSGNGIIVKGNIDGIKLAKIRIADLTKCVCSQEHFLSKPGISHFFSTPKGLDIIKFVETKEKCIIKRKMMEENAVSSSQKPVEKAEYEFYGGRKIVVVEGDITQLEVDAITNAANNEMTHHGGLAKFIISKAGQEVLKDCTSSVKANGKVPDGNILLSGPGKLPCKMIIHAVGPRWTGGQKGEQTLLKQVVDNTLKCTANKKMKSVAIPALSTGKFNYPLKDAAQTIVDTIQRYWFLESPGQTSVTLVYLCGLKQNTTKAFTDALKQITGGVFCYLDNCAEDMEKSDSDSDIDDTDEKYEKVEAEQYTDILDWVSEDAAMGRDKSIPSKIKVKTVTGELSKQTVDVIVNTVGSDLRLDLGALSRSLLTVGGQVLQADCKKYYSDGILPGGIAVTRGGNLSCKSVFHGALIPWDGGKGKAEETLRSMINSCLMQTSVNNMSSIAFPAIGTGKLGFPADIVASVLFDCIRKFEQDNPQTTIHDILLVLYPKDMATIKAFDAYEKKQQLVPGIKRSSSPNPSGATAVPVVKDTSSVSASVTMSRSVNQPVSYKLGLVTLELIKGDITKETTDVIVNSTLENLDLSKGAVSHAILRAAGRSIQDECNTTTSRTKIKQDGFVLTSPGRLQCQMIMHVKAKNKADSWRKAVTKCLDETDKLQLKSISFPALGTGGKGCDPKAVAGAIADAILGSAWSRKLKVVRLVRLVIFQSEMLNIFRTVLQEKSGQNRRSLLPALSKKGNKSVDDSITFVIFSDSETSIRSATMSLNSTVDEEFTDKLISEPYRELIKQLKDHQVKKIITIGEDTETKVTMIKDKGQIKLDGRSKQVMEANDAIAHYLRNIENEKHKKEISTFMKAQWYYMSSGDMRRFPADQNADIEMAYTQKKPTVDIKERNGEKYRINFSNMTECALSRPQHKIAVVRTDLSSSAGSPSGWSAMVPGENLKVVSLSTSDPEYSRISQRFLSSLNGRVGMAQKMSGFFRGLGGASSGNSIIQINRIQNRSLYQQFLAKRKQIEQHARNRPLDHMLWHGTSSEVVKSINHNGFDRGYCGKHGTALGAGVYFAVNAAYSVTGNYCSPDSQGHRHIYLAQVLTGDPIQGHSSMKVLPQKNPNAPHIHYDSSVDNTSDPGVYVIFHDSQAYPTYHIIFK